MKRRALFTSLLLASLPLLVGCPSAPKPVGAASTDTAYSPLWQMVKVTWQPGRVPRELRAEEAVLAAADKGDLALEPTPVVLNCAIVQRTGHGALPGVVLTQLPQ